MHYELKFEVAKANQKVYDELHDRLDTKEQWAAG